MVKHLQTPRSIPACGTFGFPLDGVIKFCKVRSSLQLLSNMSQSWPPVNSENSAKISSTIQDLFIATVDLGMHKSQCEPPGGHRCCEEQAHVSLEAHASLNVAGGNFVQAHECFSIPPHVI